MQGVSVPVSAQGEHWLHYRSIDMAGNTEADKALMFGIDTVRPVTIAPSAASAVRGRTATLGYKVTDALPNAGTATVTIKLKNRAGALVKTLKLGVRTVNGATALRARFTVPRAWKAGTYKFYIYATDRAGNAQSKVGSNRLLVR